MRIVSPTVVAVALLGACAGGSAGPMYSYAPSALLHYDLRDLTNILVEAPGQTAETVARTDAALSLQVTDPGDLEAGAALTFDSFSLDVSGDQGAFSHDGEGLVGFPFAGYFDRGGGFIASDGPEIPSDLLAQFDPIPLFVGLFPPLPDDGASAISWPHRYEVTDRTELAVTSTYDGQARFEGDTVVNGRAGRIIASEGVAVFTGHGQPADSPVPLDMEMSATVRAVYVWDYSAGAMLGARIEAEGVGTVSVQGFEIPIALSSTTTFDLRR